MELQPVDFAAKFGISGRSFNEYWVSSQFHT